MLLAETRTHLIVALDPKAYSELLSDADYYIECEGEMGPEYLGLISSARATHKALLKAGAPQPAVNARAG